MEQSISLKKQQILILECSTPSAQNQENIFRTLYF
jgi:hypothetical protein